MSPYSQNFARGALGGFGRGLIDLATMSMKNDMETARQERLAQLSGENQMSVVDAGIAARATEGSLDRTSRETIAKDKLAQTEYLLKTKDNAAGSIEYKNWTAFNKSMGELDKRRHESARNTPIGQLDPFAGVAGVDFYNAEVKTLRKRYKQEEKTALGPGVNPARDNSKVDELMNWVMSGNKANDATTMAAKPSPVTSLQPAASLQNDVDTSNQATRQPANVRTGQRETGALYNAITAISKWPEKSRQKQIERMFKKAYENGVNSLQNHERKILIDAGFISTTGQLQTQSLK